MSSNYSYERKSIRRSTAAKSAATAQRIKVRNLEQKRRVRKHKEEEWVPTQEELLEEAKITEEENLQSLEKYQRLENEKKSRRSVKKVYSGPMVRYHSTRMPVVEVKEQPMEITVDECSNQENTEKPVAQDTAEEKVDEKKKESEDTEYCERTFVTFLNDPNDELFKKTFPQSKPQLRNKNSVCAITG